MRRVGVLGLVFVALVLTTGCPFESHVPLGSPGPGSLDPQLEGRWVAVEAGAAVVEIDFLPFNGNEYYVELREKGNEPERYRAYTIRIGGEPFLNCNEVKGDLARPAFKFARYAVVRDGALALRFVGDKAVPEALGKDQKALVRFLAAHLEGAFLDDSETPAVLHRPATTPPAGETKVTP
jgi:hypothetical protein